MEWWVVLIIMLGGLIILMLTNMPTAFCFLLVSMAAAFLLWRGPSGLETYVLTIRSSIANFSLIPVVMFMLMGTVLFESGIAPLMIETLNMCLGRLPGRLAFITVAAGTILGTLSGSSMASVALLGQVLYPQMERHKYDRKLNLGSIMGSGGLAMLIPPSGIAIVIAILGNMSVGRLLIAMIVPGLLMAVLMAIYILIRCSMQPSLAPTYDVASVPLSTRFVNVGKYVLPMAFIVFLVTGLIFLGVATPTEAAATGSLGCFILTAIYGKLNWKVAKSSTEAAFRTTAMTLIIMASATAFSQLISYSGIGQGLVKIIFSSNLPPIMFVILIQVAVAIMGCFMPPMGILMIILPLFTPVIMSLHQDPVWFGIITLVNCEMAGLTPPFGMNLFTLRAVTPKSIPIQVIYQAVVPFIVIDCLLIVLLFCFPILTSWLPSLMNK